MGVPSIRSAPETRRTRPLGPSSTMASRRTHDNPMGLGRNGDRVANTPIRTLPPRRGGLTVGDQPSDSENCQISQMCEKPSRPRSASATRYAGSKTIVARSDGASDACRGNPNFVGKSLRIRAMTSTLLMRRRTGRNQGPRKSCPHKTSKSHPNGTRACATRSS